MSTKINVSFRRDRKFHFGSADNSIQASEAREQFNQVHRGWGERLLKTNTVEEHALYAFNIIPPLQKVVEFVDWTAPLFSEVTEDFNNPTLFADDEAGYTAKAWTISPDGGPVMLRPGTPVYSGISPQRIDTGLEFNVDQLRRIGWNMQERKIAEAGEELARKRYAMRYAVLDAAVSSVPANDTTVSGGKFTYAAVRNLVKASVNSYYKPNIIMLNNERAWDMGEWTDLAGNLLFDMKSDLGQEVLLRNGYFTSLFNLQFYLFDSIPENEIWYADSLGQDYDFVYMPLESAIENAPLDRVTRYRWLEDRTPYVRTGERYWRQTITA